MTEYKPLVIKRMEQQGGSIEMSLSGNRNYLVRVNSSSTTISDPDTYEILLRTDGAMCDPGGYLQQKEFMEYFAEMVKEKLG